MLLGVQLHLEFEIHLMCPNIHLKWCNNVKEKFSEGLLLQTYLISLKGEKDKIIIEYNMFHKILKSTLLSHLDISTKYFNRTSIISKEIVNDTEKINLIEKV
jgi:hypothetical protein